MLLLFIIGFEYGYLADIISNKFMMYIMNPQMEMYLSHISIDKMIIKNKAMSYLLNNMDKEFIFIIKIIIIFSIGNLYKKLLKDRLSKSMDKLLNNINKIII